MKHFGIWHKPVKNLRYYINILNLPYVVLVFLAFVVFAFYYNVTSIVFSKNKIDVFKEDLQQIALYFRTIDRDLSEFLITMNTIVEDYLAGENILLTRTQEIEQVWEYAYNNKSYLESLGFDNYSPVLEFMADTWKYKDELFTLLGKDTPQNYLVILQNSNEKRPNGWFFWSFAFIQVYQARIEHLQIVDSYFPDFIGNNTSITPPSRSQTFLPERRIAFVAANWFGFTDIDGKNIKTLYEKIFNESYNQNKVDEVMDPEVFAMLNNKFIKWVLFIETDLLETIIPTIRYKVREWQFVNAAIDIIRGESRSNKKELYIDEVNSFFQNNAMYITKHIINNFDDILNSQMMSVYLSNVSDQFNGLIQKRQLTNTYNPDTLYARDINDSYNKIDGFIDKKIEIVDRDGNLVLESDTDKLTLGTLENGEYTMTITYNLYIPNMYKDIIDGFAKKYDIELGNREKIILWLMPNVWITPEWWLRWRTRSIVYFPPYVTIPAGQDIGYRHEFFKPPFAQGLYYNMRIADNETRKSIRVQFTVNK